LKENWLSPKKRWLFDGLWFNLHYWSCKLKFLVLAQNFWSPIEKNLIIIKLWWLKDVSVTTRFKATKSCNFQSFIIIFQATQHHFDLGWPYSDMTWGYITSWQMLKHGDNPAKGRYMENISLHLLTITYFKYLPTSLLLPIPTYIHINVGQFSPTLIKKIKGSLFPIKMLIVKAYICGELKIVSIKMTHWKKTIEFWMHP